MPEPCEADQETADRVRAALKLDAFYPRLDCAQLKEFFPQSGLLSYAAESFVIEQGESSKDLYVIRSGKVSIRQQMGLAGAEMAVLGPGDLFGEMALIRDEARIASAVAVEASRIFRLVDSDLRALVERDPELGAHLKRLAERRLYG